MPAFESWRPPIRCLFRLLWDKITALTSTYRGVAGALALSLHHGPALALSFADRHESSVMRCGSGIIEADIALVTGNGQCNFPTGVQCLAAL